MSTVPQQLTTGIFTLSDEKALENKLTLVFGTPKKLEKKERLAEVCYLKVVDDESSGLDDPAIEMPQHISSFWVGSSWTAEITCGPLLSPPFS